MYENSILDFAWEYFKNKKLSTGSPVDIIEILSEQSGSESLFIQAIDLAISLDASKLARELAQRGHQKYPQSSELAHAATVLALPSVLDVSHSANNNMTANMTWIKEHSRQYLGLWVAVQQGKLLSTAKSRHELVDQIGDMALKPDVLITRIP